MNTPNPAQVAKNRERRIQDNKNTRRVVFTTSSKGDKK